MSQAFKFSLNLLWGLALFFQDLNLFASPLQQSQLSWRQSRSCCLEPLGKKRGERKKVPFDGQKARTSLRTHSLLRQALLHRSWGQNRALREVAGSGTVPSRADPRYLWHLPFCCLTQHQLPRQYWDRQRSWAQELEPWDLVSSYPAALS